MCKELGSNPSELCEDKPVPLDLLQQIAGAREDQVEKDIEYIAGTYQLVGEDSQKLGEILQFCREDVHRRSFQLLTGQIRSWEDAWEQIMGIGIDYLLRHYRSA